MAIGWCWQASCPTTTCRSTTRSALARAIEEVLADSARASALGRAGRERVAARFTWDRIAETLAAHYERVLERAPADRAQVLTSLAPLGGGQRAVHAAP